MTIDKTFKVLSNPIRLDIFKHILNEACECDLKNEEKISGNCVTQIAKELNLPQPTVSNHVKELLNAKLVKGVRRGKNIFLFGNKDVAKEVIVFCKEYLEKTL